MNRQPFLIPSLPAASLPLSLSPSLCLPLRSSVLCSPPHSLLRAFIFHSSLLSLSPSPHHRSILSPRRLSITATCSSRVGEQSGREWVGAVAVQIKRRNPAAWGDSVQKPLLAPPPPPPTPAAPSLWTMWVREGERWGGRGEVMGWFQRSCAHSGKQQLGRGSGGHADI